VLQLHRTNRPTCRRRRPSADYLFGWRDGRRPHGRLTGRIEHLEGDVKPTTAWNVTVLVPEGVPRDEGTRVTDQLLAVLDSYSPAVVRDGRHIGARIWVDAPDAVAAAAHAVAVWNHALGQAGLLDAGPVQVNVVREEEFRAQLDTANFPSLVGVSEIAEQLGVSRARASEIARTAPGFPRAVAQLASGPVWTEASVEAFAETWSRRPGRPRRRGESTPRTGARDDEAERVRLTLFAGQVE
jgi:hypothetical protein